MTINTNFPFRGISCISRFLPFSFNREKPSKIGETINNPEGRRERHENVNGYSMHKGKL